MITRVIIFAVVVPYVTCLTIDLNDPWNMFKQTYNKTYETVSKEAKRHEIFKQNTVFILTHNLQAYLGKYSFTLGINNLCDMSREEYIQLNIGSSKYESKRNLSTADKEGHEPPLHLNSTVDYRNVGLVSSVKDRKKCNSSYAFAVIGALEAANARKSEQLIELSAQQIIDCVNNEDFGCSTGSMESSYRYAMMNGIQSATSYPYTAMVGPCEYNPEGVVAQCTSFSRLPANETSLYEAVTDVGPVSVGINAGLETFRFYKGGLYDDPYCDNTIFTNTMLVIGYGVQKGASYWLIKNSAGTSWGYSGFMKMIRGRNLCGIADYAVYPVLE